MGSLTRHAFNEKQITSAIVWRVQPENRKDFEMVLQQLIGAAAEYEGVMAVHAVSPSPGGPPLYRLVIGFDSQTNFDSWQKTADLNPWIVKAHSLSASSPNIQVRSGLEAWFNDPNLGDGNAPSNPATYKTAILMWAVLFPLTLFFRWIFLLIPTDLSPLTQTGMMMAIEILLVSYFVMPQVARIFRFWLYPSATGKQN